MNRRLFRLRVRCEECGLDKQVAFHTDKKRVDWITLENTMILKFYEKYECNHPLRFTRSKSRYSIDPKTGKVA